MISGVLVCIILLFDFCLDFFWGGGSENVLLPTWLFSSHLKIIDKLTK